MPYYSSFGGAGCASQNFIFPDVLSNWFQFGRPSSVPGALQEHEPGHDVASTTDIPTLEENATFWASVKVSTAFDIELVKIALEAKASMASRDGFAVRQSHRTIQDFGYGSSSTVDVWTDLNAQTKATLDVHATIELSGLFPPFDVNFRFNLGDTGNVESMPSVGPSDPAAVSSPASACIR